MGHLASLKMKITQFSPSAELPTPETHPTMFLNQWFGPEVRSEYEIENPGFKTQIFSCTLTVQGRSFQGSGPSKKEGKSTPPCDSPT